MGLDVYAAVILGVAIEERIEDVNEIRYDEITGKPYVSSLKKQSFTFRNSSLRMTLEPDTWYDEQDGWFHTGGDYDKQSTIFGLRIVETESNRAPSGKHPSCLWREINYPSPKQVRKVREKLATLGYYADPHLYLLQILSY